MVAFIIGQNITISEKEELKQAAIKDFESAPQEFIQQINKINATLQKVKMMTNPLDVGVVRQRLIAKFYKHTNNMQEKQKPVTVQIVNRYVRVLVYDEKNNIVVTEADLNSFLHYLVFINQLHGHNLQINNRDAASMKQLFVNNFFNMSIEQKSILSSASLIWKLVNINWQRMSISQRQQFQSQVTANYQTQSNPKQNFSIPKYNKQKNITQSNIFAQQQKYAQQRQMFNTLSNISLQNHVSMLNIIENMPGGTGGVWELK